MEKRLIVTLVVAGVSAVASWTAQTYKTHWPGGDFNWAMIAAQDLIHGRDPYRYISGPEWTPYPLPAAFVGLPFSVFSPAVGGALFFGVSAGLLAFGLTTRGEYQRLLILTAFPFWFALEWAQWTPLIMAAAFFPVIMPVVLMKPHIALPVALTHPTQLGVYCCVGVGVLSLIIYPTWPLVWLSQIGQFQRFSPIATAVGPLLLLALFRWREKDAQLFLLACLFPQRLYYDAFVLWLIPKTRKEIFFTALVSWGAWIWNVRHPEMTSVGIVSSLFFFLPMLAVILLRPQKKVASLRQRRSTVGSSPSD
jgi:hypothetical protein